MSRMGCYVKWREAERPFERGNRPLMSRQRAGTYVFALVVVARTDRWWGIEARSGRNLTTAPRPVIRSECSRSSQSLHRPQKGQCQPLGERWGEAELDMWTD